MAAVDVGARHNPPAQADELDDLFNYEVPDDIFKDVDINIDAPSKSKVGPSGDGKENGGGLGLDEEIKVTKRRAPVPKLDEDRLLSQAGIPKLRVMAKKELKLKGKGHEYSDLARLLDMYQLWLDDLYPRAKFADGLTIIEKLGHSKRMQTMRKTWVNEAKPKDIYEETDLMDASKAHLRLSKNASDQAPNATSAPMLSGEGDNSRGPEAVETADSFEGHNNVEESLFVSDDEGGSGPSNMEGPMDDLDALLAEEAPQNPPAGSSANNDFDDEMEAMADFDVW